MTHTNMRAGGGSSQARRPFWFLVANPGGPERFSFSQMHVGAQKAFTLRNKDGNEREVQDYFHQVRAGDYVIGYDTTPSISCVALCKIARPSNGKDIVIEMVKRFPNKIPLKKIQSNSTLKDIEYLRTHRGTLFSLTPAEFMTLIRMAGMSVPLDAVSKEVGSTRRSGHQSETGARISTDVPDAPFMDDSKVRDLLRLLGRKKAVILAGPQKVGKTYTAKWLSRQLLGSDPTDHLVRVQFHRGTTYEDLVWGLRPNDTGDGYTPGPGVFAGFCEKAARDVTHRWVFVIENIDAVDPYAAFGDTFELVDATSRDSSVTLTTSGRSFSIPRNVYLIGTANSSHGVSEERASELLGHFALFELYPAFGTEKFEAFMSSKAEKMQILAFALKEINEDISHDERLGPARCVGHGYLLGCEGTDADAISIERYELEPLVRLLWKDDEAMRDRELERLRQAVG